MDFVAINGNFIEALGERMVLIATNVYLQQQEEYLRHNSMVIDELDREMQLLISTNSARQAEYLNNHNDNSMEEQRIKMIEDHLRTKTHVDRSEDTDLCSICLNEFEEGSCVGVLDCGHEFHRQCIKKWLVINNVCPLCKSTGVRCA
ncbi:hypothetical protein vseg_015386 [Gypsophila vaccaria]